MHLQWSRRAGHLSCFPGPVVHRPPTSPLPPRGSTGADHPPTWSDAARGGWVARQRVLFYSLVPLCCRVGLGKWQARGAPHVHLAASRRHRRWACPDIPLHPATAPPVQKPARGKCAFVVPGQVNLLSSERVLWPSSACHHLCLPVFLLSKGGVPHSLSISPQWWLIVPARVGYSGMPLHVIHNWCHFCSGFLSAVIGGRGFQQGESRG